MNRVDLLEEGSGELRHVAEADRQERADSLARALAGKKHRRIKRVQGERLEALERLDLIERRPVLLAFRISPPMS